VIRVRITPAGGSPFEGNVPGILGLANARAEAIHRHGAGTTVDVIDGEPEPAGRRIAVVFGSRAVDDTEASIWWSWRAIAGWIVEGERPDLLLVPDGRGAGFTARRFARAAGIPYDVWRLNGEVVSASGVRRWHDGPVPADPRWPLRRAAAMLDPVALARAAGAKVRALAILAPWDTGGGDRWAVERARGLGLPVIELTCPPEHGPARAALSAHTTTTATTEETAP
jgi:hypothetical protein